METKRQALQEELTRVARKSSGVVVRTKPSFTTFLGMAPMLDTITESMGGGFRVRVGGRELFTSRAYIQLQASNMPLSRRSIRMEFQECDGSMELLSVENNQEGILKMAELALKGDIATGVVHDVNNLLCALMGNMDFIATTARQKAPEMKSTVAEMQLALDSVAAAMGRMRRLLLSKGDVSKENVRDVVESAFLLIKKRLQNEWSTNGREVAVVNAVPFGLEALMVYSDVQLATVNIILNAVEHGIEKNGKIEIRGYKDESHVYLEIENDGRPVPDEIREVLLQKPVTVHCNNGFGLYASAKNIRAFGGDMTFESDSESTAFTIMLPSGTCEWPGQ